MSYFLPSNDKCEWERKRKHEVGGGQKKLTVRNQINKLLSHSLLMAPYAFLLPLYHLLCNALDDGLSLMNLELFFSYSKMLYELPSFFFKWKTTRVRIGWSQTCFNYWSTLPMLLPLVVLHLWVRTKLHTHLGAIHAAAVSIFITIMPTKFYSML